MKTKMLLSVMAAGFLIGSIPAEVKADDAIVASATPTAPNAPAAAATPAQTAPAPPTGLTVSPAPAAPAPPTGLVAFQATTAPAAPAAPAASPAPAVPVSPGPYMPGGIDGNEYYRHTNSAYGNPVSGYTNISANSQR